MLGMYDPRLIKPWRMGIVYTTYEIMGKADVVTIDEVSTHRRVIIAIHKNYLDGMAFALRDVVAEASVSSSSVVRTLKLLKAIQMITYRKKCNAGRHYRVTLRWPKEESEAIKSYEYAKILKT